MRVLIVGCGYVGEAFARKLRDEGHQIYALSRRREGRDAQGIQWVRADITAPALPPLPRVDGVLFAAAPDRGDEAGYRAIYDEAWARVLHALRDMPLQRVMYVSSTSVYGQEAGELVDEQTPAEPRSFQGRLLLVGEEHCRQSAWPHVILRLGGIYGPGRTWFLERVRAGQEALTAAASPYTNRVHRDDAVAMLHFLWHRPDGLGTFVGTDPAPTRRNEVVSYLAAAMGLEAPVLSVEQASSAVRGNKRCMPTRLQAMGYNFLYPSFREGYASLIEPR